MIKLHLSPGSPPLQISGFGSDVERTREGALHFSPGSVATISDSEWEWIKRFRPTAAKELKRLPLPGPVTVKSKPVPVEVKATEEKQSERVEETAGIALEDAPPLREGEPAAEPEKLKHKKKRRKKKKS